MKFISLFLVLAAFALPIGAHAEMDENTGTETADELNHDQTGEADELARQKDDDSQGGKAKPRPRPVPRPDPDGGGR